MPGDPAGVAGIVFGGPNNKAALVIDERGRIQTYAVVDGKLSAAQVGTQLSVEPDILTTDLKIRSFGSHRLVASLTI